MFLTRPPAPGVLDTFLRESNELPLSYGPIGMARDGTGKGRIDETVAIIGNGRRDFERARDALATWKQFDVGWVELFPRNAPLAPGTAVAILIRHLGFWSLNGGRVVYGLGHRARGAHFGIAYGTLANHAEAGEELFEVALNPDSGAVTYRIRAISTPSAALARIGCPITRLLQARFRRHSVEAMRRAVRSC